MLRTSLSQMEKTGQQLDIDFVVSTGNNFYNDGLKGVNDPAFQESFTKIYTSKSLQKPWYSLLGNHDYRGDAKAQLNPILRKIDSRWLCFSMQDLELALRESNANWKIVVGHHTIRSVIHHGDTPELIDQLLPMLEANNVDFYMNGHDHCLEHINYFVSRIQYLTSGAGSKAWRRDDKKHNHCEVHYFYDGQGFMSVQLNRTDASMVFYNVFGERRYQWNASRQLHSVM
ncbi:purple acid phosphatase 3 [Actinidia rufa]|uniref:Purple acid phosphatase 3 n=1 Tax=Actinidia rufa TaxID=165716 RepID=A0A7J0HE34_9ERIC|nr:purple acid phosphatase 3 [Actinidia rufa]